MERSSCYQWLSELKVHFLYVLWDDDPSRGGWIETRKDWTEEWAAWSKILRCSIRSDGHIGGFIWYGMRSDWCLQLDTGIALTCSSSLTILCFHKSASLWNETVYRPCQISTLFHCLFCGKTCSISGGLVWTPGIQPSNGVSFHVPQLLTLHDIATSWAKSSTFGQTHRLCPEKVTLSPHKKDKKDQWWPMKIMVVWTLPYSSVFGFYIWFC